MSTEAKGQFGVFSDAEYFAFDTAVLEIRDTASRVIIRLPRENDTKFPYGQTSFNLCVEPPPNAPLVRQAAFELCQSYANKGVNEREYARLLEPIFYMNHDFTASPSDTPVLPMPDLSPDKDVPAVIENYYHM